MPTNCARGFAQRKRLGKVSEMQVSDVKDVFLVRGVRRVSA
jgi:hypothetical protein